MPELAPDGSWFPVLDAIGSFEELHVLLSLADAWQRVWTVGELSARHPTIDVPAALAGLVASGLVWRDAERGVGLTADPALRTGAVALVAQYRSNPLLILNPLTERALERVRNAAARTFADAFVVKEEPGRVSHATYLACAAASLVVAGLLLRAWWIDRHRLLLWSGLCFAGLAVNSVAMVLDQLVLGDGDLRLVRHVSAHLAMAVLLFGLVWERA